jgi:hypothetical protein
MIPMKDVFRLAFKVNHPAGNQQVQATSSLSIAGTFVLPPICVLACCFVLCFETEAPAQMTDVLTYHNDIARTGQTLNEQILTPANVNTNQFGKLWFLPTDGMVMGEPLYAAGVLIPGQGERNVLFVVTEHDSVYAFDADSTNLFWKASMLFAGEQTSGNFQCSSMTEIGITATPVIDRKLGLNGTIFVQAMSLDSNTNYHQRLHALDLATGLDIVTPAEINATYPGTGDNSTNGTVVFDPAQYLDRASLLLLNGVIYTAWSGHCDERPYTSWVMGFDETTLAPNRVLNLTPNGWRGSIWNSGGGPAADNNGNIYIALANGTFDQSLDANGFPDAQDYGNSLVKLTTTNGSLTVADYFTMSNILAERTADMDLGSGSPLLLPTMTDGQGRARQLVITAGKDQNIYLADCSNMGKFNSSNNDALYKEVSRVFTGGHGDAPNASGDAGGIWGMPAYFNNRVYFGPVSGPITAFPFQNARLSSSSSQSPTVFRYPGSTPSISADGATNGIVWAAETVGYVGAETNQLPLNSAVLHAYAATNLAYELYNSTWATNNRDQFGVGNKFVTPMIASARVYVATTNGVGVFGLLDQSSLTPVQQWRDLYFGNPSNVGAGANATGPAGDGVPNLVKYALGLDPFTPATLDQMESATIEQISGLSYLTLTVNRAANPPDIGYTTALSSDLLNWSVNISNTTTLTNTPTQLIIRDNTPLGAGSNNFMQMLFQLLSSP